MLQLSLSLLHCIRLSTLIHVVAGLLLGQEACKVLLDIKYWLKKQHTGIGMLTMLFKLISQKRPFVLVRREVRKPNWP